MELKLSWCLSVYPFVWKALKSTTFSLRSLLAYFIGQTEPKILGVLTWLISMQTVCCRWGLSLVILFFLFCLIMSGQAPAPWVSGPWCPHQTEARRAEERRGPSPITGPWPASDHYRSRWLEQILPRGENFIIMYNGFSSSSLRYNRFVHVLVFFLGTLA